MRKLMVGLAAALMLVGTGCVYTQPQGAFVDNNVKPQKIGKSSTRSVLCFYPSGDGGIEAAMMEGNISKVHHVDYQDFWFPLLFWSRTTKVYGE